VDADLVVEEAGGRVDLVGGHGGDLVLLRVVHGHRGGRWRGRRRHASRFGGRDGWGGSSRVEAAAASNLGEKKLLS
jgi:hypothetical protein